MSEQLVGELAPAIGAVAIAALALVAAYLRRLAGKVENVKDDTRQLQRNGGSTLADSMHALREDLAELRTVPGQLQDLQRRAIVNAEGIARLDSRVTDHGRRNEETRARLQQAVEALSDAQRAAVERLAAVEARQHMSRREDRT